MKIFKKQFLNDLSTWICTVIGTAVIITLVLQFTVQVTPTTALADPTPTPTCTPPTTPVPTATITQTPTYPTPKSCSSCAASPSCIPVPTPSPADPPLVHVPGPTPGDGTQLEWRIYPPTLLPSPTATPAGTTPTPGPCVLLVHGGSFDDGNAFQMTIERAAEVLASSGFWVFVGDYRLAPCGRITNQPPHPATPTPTPTADPSPTPDPSGRPPEQTDDVMFLVKAVKASEHCAGHKVGIVGVSSGGCISSYVAMYRGVISEAGRPDWDGGTGTSGRDDRPDCVVTFSSPFDLSDQLERDLTDTVPFIPAVCNYLGTCDRDLARLASPISLISTDLVENFKPMYSVQCDKDLVCPERQVTDIEAALFNAGVCQADLTVAYITDPNPEGHSYGYDDHALALWPVPDPNDPDQVHPKSIGYRVLEFLHQHLD